MAKKRKAKADAVVVHVAPAPIQPAMLGAPAAAKYCGIGRSLFLVLVGEGRAPEPIKLGRRSLWRVADLRNWVDAGCP